MAGSGDRPGPGRKEPREMAGAGHGLTGPGSHF